MKLTGRLLLVLGAAGAIAASAGAALAQDKVKVGVNPVSASLPLYVAIERGFFKDFNIEIENIRLIGGPANVAALIGNQIEAASNMVTIEGINANIKKPGSAMYIAINSQNAKYHMEQFVARRDSGISKIADFKGKKLLVAPGPANVTMAKAVLTANGVKEGEYTLDQLDVGQHVGAIAAGTFDGGYSLEPAVSVMKKNNVATVVEAGLIAKYVLGDPNANGWVAGTVVTADFVAKRPDVAKRFAQGWDKAIKFISEKPDEARKHLVGNTLTPPDVVELVPLVGFTMTNDLTPQNVAEFQKFIDFSVSTGTLSEKVDVNKFLQRF